MELSLSYHSAHCCQRHIKPLLSTSTPGQPVICPTTLSLSQASDPLLSCCSGLLSAWLCKEGAQGCRAWLHVACAQPSLFSRSCTLPWVVLCSCFCYNLSILCLLCRTLSRFSWVRLFVTHDWSPPGSSVHEIFQARILEWVAMLFSLQGIFLTQGLNLHLLRLLHRQVDSLPLPPPYPLC